MGKVFVLFWNKSEAGHLPYSHAAVFIPEFEGRDLGCASFHPVGYIEAKEGEGYHPSV